MELIGNLLPWIQVILSIILIVLILVQQNEAGLGAGFGGSGGGGAQTFHTKRGAEKGIFITTIVVAILFGLLALLALFI